MDVTGISLSSQRVLPGDLYAALPGSRAHGASYAVEAARSGAVAVLTDETGRSWPPKPVCRFSSWPTRVPCSGRSPRGSTATRPTRSRLLAVTGTQGKTTTTRLAELALEGAGISAAVVGTVGTRVAGEDIKTALTTPEAPDLHGLFALMRERGVDACAMEVSSHALVMGRVDGVVFDVAVFTNLGRDHLDFHADMEDYFAAKAQLFTPERSRLGLVNVDDEFGRRLVAESLIETRTFSSEGAAADWQAVDVRLGADGSRFTVLGPAGQRVPRRCRSPAPSTSPTPWPRSPGQPSSGYDALAVAEGLGRAGGVPGRLERVDTGRDFHVVVDYAHKPDAVEAALGTLRPLTTGRLLVVIGAGGDRDTGKRPVMGEIAARLADVLIVTDDNPRSEDPAAIRAEMLAGTRGGTAEVREIGDRRAAIRAALELAGPGDIVLVAGKGHETGQEIAGVVHPFDDRDVVRDELATLPGGAA